MRAAVLWLYGKAGNSKTNRVKVFPLDDSGNYAELASYLIKYTGTHKKGTDGALQGNMFRYDAASGVNSLEVSIFYSKEFLGV